MMRLIEHKTTYSHYFEDEQGRLQGVGKWWYEGGQLSVMAHFRDNEFHGEYKSWYVSGEVVTHTFDVNHKKIIDFLKNPELYPTTPEEKTMFVLKYGSAPLSYTSHLIC